jgi:hypothetical protein
MREAEPWRRRDGTSEVEAQREQWRREAKEWRDVSDGDVVRCKRRRRGAWNGGASERGEAKWIFDWSEGATFLLCGMQNWV